MEQHISSIIETFFPSDHPVDLSKEGNTIPFSRPDITDEEIAGVIRVIKSGWLTQGPETELFEQEFAEFTGSRFAVAVSSATAGLHLLLAMHNLGPGDAVIVPTTTYTATAEAVAYTGAFPLLCDVDETGIITPAKILELVEKECRKSKKGLIHKSSKRIVRGIVPVHLAGRPCDLNGLSKLAGDLKLFIVEDSAHAFQTQYRGKHVGSFGEGAVFSFYATKNITTGEGGMITVQDKAAAKRLKILRRHGIERARSPKGAWDYRVVENGYKYNMNDIAAAMGRVQLKRAGDMYMRRMAAAGIYDKELEGIPGITIPDGPTEAGNVDSHHLYMIQVNAGAKKRNDLIKFLESKGIATSIHFIPLHRHPFYFNTFGYNKSAFPSAEKLFAKTLSLPLFNSITTDETRRVASAVRSYFGHGSVTE